MVSGVQRTLVGRGLGICTRSLAVVLSLASSLLLIRSVTAVIAGGIVPPEVLIVTAGYAVMVFFPLRIAFAGSGTWKRMVCGVLVVDTVYVVFGIAFMWPGVTWPDDPSPFSCGSIDCVSNLQQIEAAKEQVALEFKWTNGTPIEMGGPEMAKVNSYLNKFNGTTNIPVCYAGGKYEYNAIGVLPECSIAKSESVGLTRSLAARGVKKRVTALTYGYDPPPADYLARHGLPFPSD